MEVYGSVIEQDSEFSDFGLKLRMAR